MLYQTKHHYEDLKKIHIVFNEFRNLEQYYLTKHFLAKSVINIIRLLVSPTNNIPPYRNVIKHTVKKEIEFNVSYPTF